MPEVIRADDAPDANPRSWLQRWLAPTAAERRGRLRREVLGVTVLAVGAAGFARLWPADLESEATWRVAVDLAAFMLRTFQFHMGLFLVLVAGIAFWMRLRRAAAVLAVVIGVAVWPTVATLWPRGSAGLNGRSAGAAASAATAASRPASAGEASLRILSVNLFASNRELAALVDEIVAADADVVLVQEYTAEGRDLLRPRLVGAYPHAIESPQEDCFGVAVFSRRPFVERPRDDLIIGETGNPQIRAVVQVGGRAVALYNVHLLPPAGLIYSRIGRRELVDLARIVAAEPLPAVICGDFNFTNDSAQAEALRRAGFRDAFDLVGWGPRWTWPTFGLNAFIPGIQIDHAFLSGGLTARRAEVGVGRGSDHRPVIVEVE